MEQFRINMDRRTFLKTAGMGSIAFAASCTSEPEKTIYSLVEAPDDMVTGRAVWYASTCRECPAGCGIIAKNREGRIVKIEGNPLHPINTGKLCMRGQAALQGIYSPDRIIRPLLKDEGKWRSISFSRAKALLREKVSLSARKGSNRVRMVTEAVGQSLMTLFTESLQKWDSKPPLVCEPFAYESLKAAHETIFGIAGLASYHMDKADALVSFGADFLETWLSPVEYSRKFETMRRIKNGKKAPFVHVSPFQSLTAANADRWICCSPGSEAAVLFGLIKCALEQKGNMKTPEDLRVSLKRIVSPFTKERVVRISGISTDQYDALAKHLLGARKPLVLGTGTGSGGSHTLEAEMGAVLLNFLLDPNLILFDFTRRHRVEIAVKHAQVLDFFKSLTGTPAGLLLINNTNPVFALPPGSGIRQAMGRESLFVVSFSNFMDETTALADLVFPVKLPLETWDEYGGKAGILSMLQPAMGRLTRAPAIGDVFLDCFFPENRPAADFKSYLIGRLLSDEAFKDSGGWIRTVQKGGSFQEPASKRVQPSAADKSGILKKLDDAAKSLSASSENDFVFMAVPSIRFFDGRGANKPWLCEIPDPLTKVTWQTTVLVHPKTLGAQGLVQGDVVELRSEFGELKAPAFETPGVHPRAFVMGMGQGHENYGRYAKRIGVNPVKMVSPLPAPGCGGPCFAVGRISAKKTGQSVELAHTDGSKTQHGRKIALSVDVKKQASHKKHGLGMHDFPLTLPLPEGYDPKRDIYPPHDHDNYRWAMGVDLDRCIGCGACAAACYAENNIGVVGEKRVIEGREMSWIRIERYHDPDRMDRITFLPMMCQHCDSAPCEAVCPVYAPHHSREGLNNQIYNRCIGTRFCAQNCPYKVRRFNWFEWKWPSPLNLQLNPDVTVRYMGVMEKCSFCIQRIKVAHGIAKNENRKIRDGEIQPACVQTCPTNAIGFGNLMDKKSLVRQMARDRRAYQIMGYLNTKPAVFYLKKVVQEI